MTTTSVPTRRRVRVEGIVQGVGFRPFVHGLATRLGLTGWVGNDARGVVAEVEGEPAALAAFARAVEHEAPPLALVERVAVEPVPPVGDGGFVIVASDPSGERAALVAPDTATCADCLREVDDPSDRRFRYPFVNCTNCGPRFTIVRDVPYDRSRTTMASFDLCPACAAEYDDPADRRFHAQPVCCPACGPQLALVDRAGQPLAPRGDASLRAALGRIGAGDVVAVKGLGGYHLAADATSDRAVGALRARKHRAEKPFAVLVADVEAAHGLARVGDHEAALLESPRRPIVLLERHSGAAVASQVAPGNRALGLLLPPTALHHLLAREAGVPLVLTSGNVSDEPIAYEDAEALTRLGTIADCFLTHDRAIEVRTDDSVARVVAGRPMVLRRARGYAPQPVPLPLALRRPVLGCGAELKSTFCLATGRRAFVSHHIGDLENAETLRSYTTGIEHFSRLFDVAPEVVAHDLHPEYLSTKYALDRVGVDLVGVQHHHAHIAACLADNGEQGPVIGVAFDGLGYGTDATLWGGELLVADLLQARRAGHLESVPLPGGPAAIRQPWRMAAAYLDLLYGERLPSGLAVVERNCDRWDAVVAVAHSPVHAPPTSSVGRLFDAVAALVDGRDAIAYEGQAAIELEQHADADERGCYRIGVERGETVVLRGRDLVRAVVDDLARGTHPATIAARFHRGLAAAVSDGVAAVAADCGLEVVALSGGVFQNVLLLELATAALRDRGFRVLVHSRVPPNDGGISLGQVAVAGARDALA